MNNTQSPFRAHRFPILAIAMVFAGVVSAAAEDKGGSIAHLPSKPGPHIEKIKALGDNEWLNLGAAAAYYGSADRLAPRLILLDEAFAGVSTDNRSSCLELLVSFDLDVVMTSENERCCDPTVPALAICRLSRAPDLPVVLNDVYVWNGKRQQGPAENSPPVSELPLFAAQVASAAEAPSATSVNGEPN